MHAKQKVMALRGAGLVLVTAVTAAASVWGADFPVLHIVAAAVCWTVGKVVGVPADAVTQLALTLMRPERAVDTAVSALRSFPPEQAESATRTLMSSIAPAARERVVRFVNASSSEPSASDAAAQSVHAPLADKLPAIDSSEALRAPPPKSQQR